MLWQNGFGIFETVTIGHFQRIFENSVIHKMLNSSKSRYFQKAFKSDKTTILWRGASYRS